MNEHEAAVAEFFQTKKETEPEKYAEVCDKYAIITRGKLATIWKKEITTGLLGHSPSRVSPQTAAQASMDTSYYNED